MQDEMFDGTTWSIASYLVLVMLPLLFLIILQFLHRQFDLSAEIVTRNLIVGLLAITLGAALAILGGMMADNLGRIIQTLGNTGMLYFSIRLLAATLAVSSNRLLIWITKNEYLLLFISSTLMFSALFTDHADYFRRVSFSLLFGSSFLLCSWFRVLAWKNSSVGNKVITITLLIGSIGEVVPITLIILFEPSDASPILFVMQMLILFGLIVGTLVTVIESAMAKLYLEANIDEMTGLFNRRFFFSQAPSLIKLALRKQSSSCICYGDIDNFKLINDNYGHKVGDQVLIAVSEVIRNTVRDSDLPIRFGGEEFIILFPFETLDSCLFSVDRLLQKIEQLGNSERFPFAITLSAGIALTSETVGLEKSISHADKALYQAKTTGKNKVVVAAENLFPLPEKLI